METSESPLEVLSRAATMIQENQQAVMNSSGNNSTDDGTKQTNKQLPTNKWKRDRRSRLPEYSRKSDPKLPETSTNESSPDCETTSNNNTPLDMSVRQRGLPPSYTQTINNPNYRSNLNLKNIHPSRNRDDLPPGISMCDPIIDEHFRRSLGNDYLALFANRNKESNVPTTKLQTQSTPKCGDRDVCELMDNSGLSVDEHFAKALGDTWLKLNKKETKTTSENLNNLVSI